MRQFGCKLCGFVFSYNLLKKTFKVKNEDVYSKDKGVGKLLEDNGLENVKAENGALKTHHKKALASFIFQNLTAKHFEENPTAILAPNKAQLQDLKSNLDALFNYIITINDLG